MSFNFSVTNASQPGNGLRVTIDADRPTIARVMNTLLDVPTANGSHPPTSHRGPGRPPGPAGGSGKSPRSEAGTVRPKRGHTEFTCGWCSNRTTGRPGQKFCSQRCSAKAGLLMQKQRRSNGSAAPEPRPEQ